VLITAGTPENGPIEVAGEISRKKGRVVVVGAVGMNLPREPYYKKELELRFSTSYGPGRYDDRYEEKGHDYPYGYVRWTENRNMGAFLTLVQQGKLNVKDLVTHRYPVEEAGRAYELMIRNQEPYLGILISYPLDVPVMINRVTQVVRSLPPGRLNLGIIGAGRHVRDRLLPCLLSMKELQVRAICTASGIHAKALAEKTKAAYGTTDYREVLKDPLVNAVLIGTRHDLHGLLVAEALEAGKHVLVEKPLCLTEEELDRIIAIYEVKAPMGLHLAVGFNRRFSPHADRARGFIKDRKNPMVMNYRVNAGPLPAEHWAQDPEIGGGRIVGEACHFVDYMQSVCGAPPVSVHARRIGRHGSGIVDDQSILSFAFGDGSVGTVVYTAGGDSFLGKERFEAFGDGKSLVMDDFVRSEFFAGQKRTTFTSGRQDKGFQAEMTRWVQSVVRGEAPVMSFAEIQAVTRACILAVRSLRTGQVYDV
jgi:predicted dehydrogenase